MNRLQQLALGYGCRVDVPREVLIMLKSKFTLGAIALACLSAGWFAGVTELSVEAQRNRTDPNGREPVEGISRNPSIQRVSTTTLGNRLSAVISLNFQPA